jgi:hypothetical protein
LSKPAVNGIGPAKRGLLLGRWLFVPNALAAPFTFEKANCLSMLGIEKLMDELKGGGTRRAVKEPILRLWLSVVVHAPSLPYRR